MKNKYEIRGDITAIFLKKRDGDILEALIDTKNLEKVNTLNVSWNAHWDNHIKGYYCKTSKYLGIVEGKPKYQTISLHSVIMNPVKGMVVDHVNHNGLDNRECNLEIMSNKKNVTKRRGANPNGTTGYRNVSYDRRNNKYIVQLQVDGKNTCFGRFDKLEDAVKCSEEMRNKIYNNKK